MIRPPAVAGQFYPGSAVQVVAQLDQLIHPSSVQQDAIAIVVPHAGWMYSGPTAGLVYSEVRIPDHVIMVGPNHHGVGSPYALDSSGAWRTPVGDAVIDEDLSVRLRGHCHLLAEDTRAHGHEHSLKCKCRCSCG